MNWNNCYEICEVATSTFGWHWGKVSSGTCSAATKPPMSVTFSCSMIGSSSGGVKLSIPTGSLTQFLLHRWCSYRYTGCSHQYCKVNMRIQMYLRLWIEFKCVAYLEEVWVTFCPLLFMQICRKLALHRTNTPLKEFSSSNMKQWNGIRTIYTRCLRALDAHRESAAR